MFIFVILPLSILLQIYFRLLAEYLGMDNMLALVCKTFDGVKGLEKYEKDGIVDKSSGVHGLARSVGKLLDRRFTVFCLENLRCVSNVFTSLILF